MKYQTKNKANFSVLEILRKIILGNADKIEINRFIEFCVRISHQYIKAQRDKIIKYLASNRVDTFDLAVKAISNLFFTDDKGAFFNLKNAFENWKQEITSDDEALYFISQVIRGLANQQITAQIKEQSPLFSKILDSVEYLIEKSNFVKKKHMGVVYIMKTATEKADKPFIDYFDFQKIPLECFLDEKIMLKSLFDYIAKETDYYPSIPLNLLIYRLMELKNGYIGTPNSVYDEHDNLVVNEIINIALQKTLDVLLSINAKKRKYNSNDIFILKSALGDLAEDFKNGNTKSHLIEYVTYYKKDLTAENYRKKYHNTFEYLVKVLKFHIKEGISD